MSLDLNDILKFTLKHFYLLSMKTLQSNEYNQYFVFLDQEYFGYVEENATIRPICNKLEVRGGSEAQFKFLRCSTSLILGVSHRFREKSTEVISCIR